jgi:DNA replication protein DnaC
VTASCQPKGFVVERLGDHAVARPESRIEDCVTCGGVGLISQTVTDNGRKYQVSSPCPSQKLKGRLQLFNEAHLPAVHAQATFETFKPYGNEQDYALRTARAFAIGYPTDRGFVLSGPVGTGKTHLLASALKFATIEKGVRAAYIEISLLFATIRRGFNEGKSGGEIIGPLSQIDVLAIDELGKGRGSPFELETLDELIARRYNAAKVTIFATNFSLKSPEERPTSGYVKTEDSKAEGKESKLLCDRVGPRIYSRLCEMCDFVEFSAATNDFRRARATSQRPNKSNP